MKRRATSARRVVMEVTRVRLKTSLMLLLTSGMNSSLPRLAMFSRILSNTTTVSVSEYPASVRRAVMIRRFISLLSTNKSPMTTSTSWNVAATAATPNLNSNRHATYMRMASMEIPTAHSASRWSCLPTVGPTSVVESTVNGLSGAAFENASPMAFDVDLRSVSDLLSLTRSLLPPARL